MVKLILLLILISGCIQRNKQAHSEISRFMIHNAKMTCVTIEKDDSDEAYVVERMTIVCGKRYIDD